MALPLLGLPLVVGSIMGGIASALGTLVGRILVSIGIGFIAYNGIDLMITAAKDQIFTRFALLPPDVYTVINLLQVPAVINLYVSAWMTALSIAGLQNGAIVKRVQRMPGT